MEPKDDVKTYTSNGLPIPFTGTYFEELQPATAVVGPELVAQYQRDGFVYLPSFLDRELILSIREQYLNLFDPIIFKPGTPVVDGIFSGKFQFAPAQHGHKDHPASQFVRSDMFKQFTANPKLKAIASLLLGGDVVELQRKPLRHFYKGTHVASKAHCDFTYLDDGTDRLLSIWIPLGDISMDTGGLLYLKNSHKIDLGVLRKNVNGGDTTSVDSRPIAGDLKAVADITGLPWLYRDYKAGDIVVHDPFIVHASLDCNSDAMRISTDLRFADAGGKLDPRWLNTWRGDDGY